MGVLSHLNPFGGGDGSSDVVAKTHEKTLSTTATVYDYDVEFRNGSSDLYSGVRIEAEDGHFCVYEPEVTVSKEMVAISLSETVPQPRAKVQWVQVEIIPSDAISRIITQADFEKSFEVTEEVTEYVVEGNE